MTAAALPRARPGRTHDGSSVRAGDARAPHTPGAATPAQALNSLYLQPPPPRRVAPRGACRWAGRAVPPPRAGPDLWSAAVFCESAQHLLTGEGARDELSPFTETSVCPNSSAASPSRYSAQLVTWNPPCSAPGDRSSVPCPPPLPGALSAADQVLKPLPRRPQQEGGPGRGRLGSLGTWG